MYGEGENLRRPVDKHIDNEELNALVAPSADTRQNPHGLSQDSVREAERHVESCGDCSSKVSKYRQLVNRSSNVVVSEAAPPGAHCPNDRDVSWHEVAAGLWPELKAKQLIMHAALCDHCGPLLRAATSVDDDPTPDEEKLLAELKAPSRPDFIPRRVLPPPPSPRRFMRWLVPALALMVIVGVLVTRPPSSPTPLSGPKFAAFAVSTQRQHVQGSLVLDVRSASKQTLNECLKVRHPFSLALPASPAAPGEERPYRLERARLGQAGSKPALIIACQMGTDPSSLMVTPESVRTPSGAVKNDCQKSSFRYRMV